MASNSVDPLQILREALAVPANSEQQANLLTTLRESLETHPAPIPILATTLIGIIVNAADSLLKRWVLDLIHFAICRSTLILEQRTSMAAQALDALAQLLDDPKPTTAKVAIQCLTTVYPLLFRQMCTNRNNPLAWNTLSTCKTRIIELVWAPKTNVGVRLSAMKFVQRVILVQTRGISDPRLQNKNDPNISFCPVDHPFISVAKLEAEGQKLLEGLVATLYSSQDVDLLSAMLNSWVTLVKQRPATAPVLINALKQWTPSALIGIPASSVKSVEKAIRILLTHLLRGSSTGQQYGALIQEALAQQGVRMDKAAAEEKKRKATAAENRKRPATTTAEQPSDTKRPKLESETTSSTPAPAALLASFDFTSLPAPLITDLIVANLQAFSEPALLNLVQAYRQSRGLNASLAAAVPPPQAAATSQPASTPAPVLGPVPVRPPAGAVPPSGPKKSGAPSPSSTPVPQPVHAVPDIEIVKDEPIDPLQMDIDQDELEYEPERLNATLSGGGTVAAEEEEITMAEVDSEAINLQLIDFKLPPPRELAENERRVLLNTTVTRIWDEAEEFKSMEESIPTDSIQAGGSSATEMWMLLLVRMVTRVAEPPMENDDHAMDDSTKDGDQELVIQDFYERQDKLRQTLCDYIMADFPSRVRLATTWMNEEWYNDQIRLRKPQSGANWRPNYDIWLNQIVVSYQTLLGNKDRTFSRFLLDLPTVPPEVLDLLRDLCIDFNNPDKMPVGFTTLRGLVIQRPSMRTEALNILLELTTHPDKKTRGAAINTVKLWVHTPPMDGMIREFALQMLRKLQLHPADIEPKSQPDVQMEDVDSSNQDQDVAAVETIQAEKFISEDGQGENMEDGQLPQEDLLNTPYLPERIELPAQKAQVLQHVELLFALSVKVPEFLDEIFAAYGQMDVTVQEAIQELLTPLIRSLGSSHGKLLTLMRTFPPGAESLALRVLTIFTEHGRPSGQLVALVKALINERDLDARFLIPIIAEMDKADIMRHLPRIVSMLNGQPEQKNVVRSVFSSIVTTPPQTFGSVTSNQPRDRQSGLLNPADLMVLLHKSEKEIGLKSAIEAIGICFSMTDVFRSEVLAVVMQQIMDEPVLPVLFLRTVIQAVTTYKSLVRFVSTTLLSRLITKKIWTNPPLWEGFIRCAKVIAPASFGALLQLPKDQLRELVDKQPSLKFGLRDYVTKKAPNKARGAGFLDIFGEAEESSNQTSAPSTPQPDSQNGSPAPP
ncbi:Symplekin tight junction protein C terminal-domain-containing protein [Crucibulum laeve]|uniref:Symplekin tight junction protein C terminal-domain-containing protein n=1 Tax=Crucibulum laeve TaxID=68775 RepID=A0A5C3LJP0_9AGAR|nr:Symplekin tight junction protein C terminal-domain-containing protein [Crucibulum laeve]